MAAVKRQRTQNLARSGALISPAIAAAAVLVKLHTYPALLTTSSGTITE